MAYPVDNFRKSVRYLSEGADISEGFRGTMYAADSGTIYGYPNLHTIIEGDSGYSFIYIGASFYGENGSRVSEGDELKVNYYQAKQVFRIQRGHKVNLNDRKLEVDVSTFDFVSKKPNIADLVLKDMRDTISKLTAQVEAQKLLLAEKESIRYQWKRIVQWVKRVTGNK